MVSRSRAAILPTLAVAGLAIVAIMVSLFAEAAVGSEVGPGPQARDRVAAMASAILPEEDRWWHCGESSIAVECGWLEVPLVHADPGSATISLPVSRIRALDDTIRIGVLVTIAGGPGQRGTDGIWPGAHTEAIHQRFDIVSWDPRGTSHESLIDCIPEWDPLVGFDRTPDEPAERQVLDERLAALASQCREAHGELLPYVGTFDTALDLERLRQQLGESRISILGSSYGSQVALLYATLFPDRVRALVVDGYSDPNLSPGDREIEQAAAFERELDELLVGCASDPDCPFHSGGEPGKALDQLLGRLDGAPRPAAGQSGRTLSHSDAVEAIMGSLVRDTSARRHLLSALASAAQGDGRPLRDIADDVRRGYESSGLSLGVYMAIYCADSASYWDGLSSDEVARITQRVREVAPRLGASLWSPPASRDLPPVGLCAMQQRASPRGPLRVDAAGAGPILLLASLGDPTTPIEGARRGVEDLEHAVLVTLDADHHLAYHLAVQAAEQSSYRCVLDIVEAYLIELELPPERASC